MEQDQQLPEQNQPTTESISKNLETFRNKTDEEKVISQLLSTIEELKKDVQAIKNDKVLDTLKLPEELTRDLGISNQKPKRRLKPGWGARPLLESEIEEAYTNTSGSAADAARYLGVHYRTLKKWAKKYNIWRVAPHTKGVKRPKNAECGKYPLTEILEGKHPDVPSYRIREKLFRSGLKEQKCEMCGFAEKRITDGRLPLLLNFADNNPKNHSIGNMLILCYNCTFISGRGFVRRGDSSYSFK
jgi:hypothetical protein